MDIFADTGLRPDDLMLLATGVGVGMVLAVALSARGAGRSREAALLGRIEKLEQRLAAGRHATTLAAAVTTAETSIHALAQAGGRVVLAGGTRLQLKPARQGDAEDIGRAFSEAMRDNTVAAVEIARHIIDQAVNLNDAKDRREVTGRVKAEAAKLTTAFWDRHGDLFRASNLPANLKDLLQVFFAQVRRLKTAVTELPATPGFADLDAVLEHAIDLLDTAKAIVDELERLGSDGD